MLGARFQDFKPRAREDRSVRQIRFRSCVYHAHRKSDDTLAERVEIRKFHFSDVCPPIKAPRSFRAFSENRYRRSTPLREKCEFFYFDPIVACRCNIGDRRVTLVADRVQACTIKGTSFWYTLVCTRDYDGV